MLTARLMMLTITMNKFSSRGARSLVQGEHLALGRYETTKKRICVPPHCKNDSVTNLGYSNAAAIRIY